MEYVGIVLALINLIFLFVLYMKISKKPQDDKTEERMQAQFAQLRQDITQNMQITVKTMGDMLSDTQRLTATAQEKQISNIEKELSQKQENHSREVMKTLTQTEKIISEKQDNLGKYVTGTLSQFEGRFKTFSLENEQKLDNIRGSVEKKLTYLQEDNNKKLDDIRKIVDEKLQKSLEEGMTRSFALVNERLEQVYKGLGEMQTLATGVGDLKKVLSNVKTRGVLGEIQLGAILEEIMAPEQYDINVATVKGSKNHVEYAIKIPTENDGFIYMPIDSKFPADVYTKLLDAYDAGSAELVQAAANELKARIRSFAKDIRDKYISVPHTTEFAVMFLPFEGLYAEAVNRGMIEILQREYKVNLAGPSTMAALLNSLQMGFRAVAVQKRSSEVWEILGAVKSEFDKFGAVLMQTQQRLDQANTELDKLVGVRTRQIQRRLKTITTLDDYSPSLLYSADTEEDTETKTL